jgi:hypothetical protein
MEILYLKIRYFEGIKDIYMYLHNAKGDYQNYRKEFKLGEFGFTRY